jgi:hypothetical protein
MPDYSHKKLANFSAWLHGKDACVRNKNNNKAKLRPALYVRTNAGKKR